MNRVHAAQIALSLKDQDHLWQIVLTRDSSYDGVFVFGVRSTGIYCRPSCPARRALRKQVEFFPLPEAAEQAGFRACRRCHPRLAGLKASRVAMVQKACQYLESSHENLRTLSDLSQHIGMSPFHLQRTFKDVMGITPRQYAEARRTERFKEELRGGRAIVDAMYEVGFGSSSRVYEKASTLLGMTPATYGRCGKGAAISYTIMPCDLGQLLVASTDRGLCAVKLGDSEATLEAELLAEFKAAQLERDDSVLQAPVQDLLRYLYGKQPHIDLPLEIRATAFQYRVWQELRTIPYGETRSYSDVAKAIGKPNAVRAVARACATNPIALVIPCHRVVGRNGSLSGYRWGLERKQILLERERLGTRKGD